MVFSGADLNRNENVRLQDKKLSRYILRKQLELVSETNALIQDSFESQFLEKKSFQALCFLVVCHRNFAVDDKMLEDCLCLMYIEEDRLLDTIQEFFAMHDKIIPDTLLKVVKSMSKLLQ